MVPSLQAVTASLAPISGHVFDGSGALPPPPHGEKPGALEVVAQRLVGKVTACIGRRLARAKDETGLDLQLSKLLADARFCALLRELDTLVTLQDTRELAAIVKSGLPPAWRGRLGDEVDEQLLTQGVMLLGATGQAMLQVYARASASESNEAMPPWVQRRSDTRDMPGLAFAYDPESPPELAAAVVAGVRAEICVFGLGVAMKQAGSRWLIRPLLERWVTGQRGYLRLLAGIPGAGVPPELLAPDRPLDIPAIIADHEAGEQAYRQISQQARFSQDEVFYPLRDPADA